MPVDSTPLTRSREARKAQLYAHLETRFPCNGRVWAQDTGLKDRIFHAIDYASRAAEPRTTSWYEFADVRRILDDFLRINPLPEDALIADIGAGDGRITALLKEYGFRNIIALDIDYENVERLSRRYDCDAICAPFSGESLFPEGTFDLIIAWGLLTCIPDFPAALADLTRYTAVGGALITAEPTLESVLLYTIARGDTAEFVRTYQSGSRAAMWHDKEVRYTVFTTAQLREWMYSASGLEVLHERNIGIFPSLLAGGLLQEQKFSPQESAWFLDSIDFTAVDGVPRQIAFLSRRSE